MKPPLQLLCSILGLFLGLCRAISLFRLDKYRKVLLLCLPMTYHDEVPLNAREPDWDAREVLQRCLVEARFRATPVAQVPVEVIEALLLLLSLPPEVDLGG